MVKPYAFAVLAMLLWGIAPIFAKLGLGKLEPLVALTVRSSIVTFVLLVYVISGGHWAGIVNASLREVVFIALEGLFGALLGQLAYYLALKHGDVSNISPVTAAFPLVALTLAIVVLGEKFTLWKIIGAVMIVTGIVMLNH